MRCIVTGVAGFVGSSIADRLLADGHEVIGIDCFIDYYPREAKLMNLESARSQNKFTFLEKNVLDAEIVPVFEGVDFIFHQAAQAGVRASWGESFSIYTDNNILATQRLLELCRSDAVRPTLKKVVYASSSSVYGDAETLPTNEDLRPQPVSPYGVSKLAAEHLMVLYAKEFGVPTVSLRYFTVYGPRQRPDMAFHRFIRAGLEGKPISVYGDGEQSRDFTFIDDIVSANLTAAQTSTSSLVFNIGGGSRVTVNQVIEKLNLLLPSPLNVNYLQRALGDVRHTGADTSRAQNELDYQPKVALEEGLRHEVDWLAELLRRNG